MRKSLAVLTALIVIAGAVVGLTTAGAQSGASDKRATPPSVTFSVTPKTDRKRPYRYTVTARVNQPTTFPPGLTCPPGQTQTDANGNPYCPPLPRDRACDNARVQVRYKAGKGRKNTISTRRFAARFRPAANGQPPFCEARGTTSFKDRGRFKGNSKLKVQVRFLGNAFMKPKSAKDKTVNAPRRSRRR